MRSLREYNISTSYGTIHTLEQGSGVPLVFFHGWSVNGFTCLRVIETMSKHHRVLVPTMPGFTPSFDWKKKPTPDDFQKVLSEWYDAVHITKPVIVGHSLGGVMAVLLTSVREEKLRKLILIDTVGAPAPRHSKDWVSAWLKKRVNTYRRYGVYDVVRYVDQAFIKNAIFRTKDFLYLSKFARQVDVREHIKKFTLPLTILWGEEDVFTPVAIAHSIQKVYPKARLHMVPGNHDWPIFDPRELEKFL